MKLWEVFVDTVVLKHGMLVDGERQGTDGSLTARDVISGRIPILWTKTVTEEGIGDRDYRKLLR